MKPTERTLKYLRDDGFICDMVERWIRNPKHPAGGFRRDLFGFADILAFKPDSPETMLVQSCGSDFAAHKRKIKEAPLASEWLRHHKIMLIGWRKLKKKRGGKQMVWRPRIETYSNWKDGISVEINTADLKRWKPKIQQGPSGKIMGGKDGTNEI